MSGHTPGPWIHDPNDDAGWGFVRGPDGMPVARTDMSARYELADTGKPAPREISANAELIVRAVNEREALIAALRAAVEEMCVMRAWASELPDPYLDSDPTVRHELLADMTRGVAVRDSARAALAKADTA